LRHSPGAALACERADRGALRSDAGLLRRVLGHLRARRKGSSPAGTSRRSRLGRAGCEVEPGHRRRVAGLSPWIWMTGGGVPISFAGGSSAQSTWWSASPSVTCRSSTRIPATCRVARLLASRRLCRQHRGRRQPDHRTAPAQPGGLPLLRRRAAITATSPCLLASEPARGRPPNGQTVQAHLWRWPTPARMHQWHHNDGHCPLALRSDGSKGNI
jgi:hypothetical protein